MAYQLMGNSPISRASNAASAAYTWIDNTVSSPGRGILKIVQVYANGTPTITPRIFRSDGTNFIWVADGASLALAAGLNTINLWIPIEKGYLIGWYNTTANAVVYTNTGGSNYHKSGNITGTSTIASWTSTVYVFSIQGQVYSRMAPLVS